MNILITGGNGYVARALYAQLSSLYNVTSISRNDFDLTDHAQTSEWFVDKQFDVVIHTAISGGSRLVKDSVNVLDNNLKMYYNLLDNSDKFYKFINIGSGAELFQTNTPYGLSKYVIRQSLLSKDNFYNLRIFAVFDENELNTRFIKANLLRYINHTPIRIHSNMEMDFFYMEDFVELIKYYIDNTDVPKEFDCTYSTSTSLKKIAEIINTLSDYTVDIIEESPPSISYYAGEHTPIKLDFIGLHAGIQKVYNNLLCKK